MKKEVTKLFIACNLLMSQVCFGQTDYQKIVSNINSHLVSLTNLAAVNSSVTSLINNQHANGSWPDINYASGAAGDEPHANHLGRIYKLAQAFSIPGGTYYADSTAFEKFALALQYWNAHIHTAANWWYNQIWYPQQLGQTLILMRGAGQHLSATDSTNTMNYLASRQNPSVQTGANRIDVALHWLYRGALTANSGVVNTAVSQAGSTLKLVSSGSEGINYDNNFLQHGPQLMTQTYGHVLVNGVYQILSYIIGTSYGYSTAQRETAFTFLHHSFNGAARGRYKDFSLDGRGISRAGDLSLNASIVALAMYADPANSAALRDDSMRLSGVQPASYNVAAPYHTHYWTGDYTLHNQPGYSFSVRSVSTRTNRSESINGENLLGTFLSEGATNIRINGGENYNIFPVWDWNKVPGITMRQFDTPQANPISCCAGGNYSSNQSFVGGVSDSTYGASANTMDYYNVTAKKSWFFFDKEVVCLGAGINSTSPENVATSVNQCLLNGSVSLHSGGTVSMLDAQTQTNYNGNLQWVLHNGIGYFFPAGGNVTVSNQTQTGTWRSINNGGTTTPINTNVFKMWLSHGVAPANATYAYTVVPNMDSTSQMAAYNQGSISIISNTTSVQAVKHTGLKMLQVIFRAAGTITDSSTGLTIITDKPCAILVKNIGSPVLQLSIADPAQTTASINIGVVLPNSSDTINTLVSMPTDNYRGSSVAFAVTKGNADVLLPAVADAYVRDGIYAGDNFGLANALIVKKDPGVSYSRETFIKFDLHGLPRNIIGAKLRLYGSGNTQAGLVQWALSKTNNNTWTETGITWNNKPAPNVLLATIPGSPVAKYSEWDITNAIGNVSADSLLSLHLAGTIPNGLGDVTFNSRETSTASFRPYIVLDTLDYKADSLLPVADAFVRNGSYAADNFGNSPSLVVKNDQLSYARQSYLKFDLRSLKGTIKSAKLRLHGSGNTQANQVQWALYKANNDNWTETGLNWNNKPNGDVLLTTIAGKIAAGYSFWDITAQLASLAGDSTLTLQLVGTVANPLGDATFYSKEATNSLHKPYIMLLMDTTDGQSLMAAPALHSEAAMIPQQVAAGQSNVKVYPNPATNKCVVEAGWVIKTISVYDMGWKPIKTINNISTQQYTLSLAGLVKGTYLIVVSGNGFEQTIKVIKKG